MAQNFHAFIVPRQHVNLLCEGIWNLLVLIYLCNEMMTKFQIYNTYVLVTMGFAKFKYSFNIKTVYNKLAMQVPL